MDTDNRAHDESEEEHGLSIEDLIHQPQEWIPQPGESLEGLLVRYEDWPGRWEDTVRVAIIESEDGLKSVTLSSLVPRQQFELKTPEPGERIRVTYLGKRKGRNKYEYYDHRLLVLDREEVPKDVCPACLQKLPRWAVRSAGGGKLVGLHMCPLFTRWTATGLTPPGCPGRVER